MIKKIVLIFVLIFSLFVWNITFAETITTDKWIQVDSAHYDPSTDGRAIKTTPWVDDSKAARDALNSGDFKWAEAAAAKASNDAEAARNPTWTEWWSVATERWVSADWTMINPWDKIEGKDDKKEGWDSKWWSDWGWWGIWWWGWPDDISSKDFEIDTSLFSIGWSSLKWWDSKTTINNTLWNVIKKLMIALWVISLFVMTVWAWYMIMYHWHDEYLSKWKNIFIWWITALIVALSSYYLVNLVWYILYS